MILNLFDDVYSPVKPELIVEATWEIIAETLMARLPCQAKTDTPLFNLWSFKTQDFVVAPKGGISRYKENALGVWGLILDYDGEKDDNGEVILNTTIDEAQAQLQEYEYVLYTSFRHLKDGILNKFRVVLPFAEMLSTEQFNAKREGLMNQFPLVDTASFSASQAFYLHSAWNPDCAFSIHHPGAFLDPQTIPNAVPKVSERVKQQILHNPITWQKPSNVYTTKVLDHLNEISGMHYADAMRLANAVKGSGGEFWDYKMLCDQVFAYDSSHREKSTRFLQDEFNRAYERVTKQSVNKLLQDYGVKSLPVLCLP
jgi:hypothetical protein